MAGALAQLSRELRGSQCARTVFESGSGVAPGLRSQAAASDIAAWPAGAGNIRSSWRGTCRYLGRCGRASGSAANSRRDGARRSPTAGASSPSPNQRPEKEISHAGYRLCDSVRGQVDHHDHDIFTRTGTPKPGSMRVVAALRPRHRRARRLAEARRAPPGRTAWVRALTSVASATTVAAAAWNMNVGEVIRLPKPLADVEIRAGRARLGAAARAAERRMTLAEAGYRFNGRRRRARGTPRAGISGGGSAIPDSRPPGETAATTHHRA